MNVTKNRIELTQVNISTMGMDVIFKAAKESPLDVSGVDGSIYSGAGLELIKESRTYRRGNSAQAKITNGHNLKEKFVIQTFGPFWSD